jgi:hypothetical protein
MRHRGRNRLFLSKGLESAISRTPDRAPSQSAQGRFLNIRQVIEIE